MTKITQNEKDFLNEVSFYNLYQNQLLHKSNYGGRHYEHVRQSRSDSGIDLQVRVLATF